MGLGLLFLSLEQMTTVTQPLRNYAPFISAMQRMENPVLGIFFGAIFTIIVQSSSASTGVVLALMSQGLLTLPAALAIAIGANVGTCLTTLVAA
nr:Na/Pi symporter [Akkermansiaceae bacterium]